MGKISQGAAHLALDELPTDPRLARRLPAELACRFHALPVAEENGYITVAMADPDDTEAREAIVTALGPKSCVVQGDRQTIEALLAGIWGDEINHSLHLCTCGFPHPIAAEVADYAQAIGGLLGARVSHLTTIGEMDALIAENRCTEHDLVIFEKPDHPMIRRLLSRPMADREPTSQRSPVPFALLIAQRPRWPLRRVLLVFQGEDTDDAAVDWALRLAQQGVSSVTILAVVPPVPAMYSGQARMDQGLPALLTTNTALGRQMRRVARHLSDWEVEGILRLRQGPPEWQIRRELAEKDYDLVAVAARPRSWSRYLALRWLEGDLISPLLRWAGRPVLVARPTTA